MIVDGNSILYRGFYALPLLSNGEGIFTNAVYGFLNIFLKAIKELKPTHICVAFDYGKKTFRNELYGEYKATRKETPDELVMQFPIIKDTLTAMGIKYIELPNFEGDDILGTISKKFSNSQNIILTGDRDNLQLIDKNTTVYLTKKGITDLKIYDEKELMSEKGIVPSQIIDVKAIMGDVSDNIPGVKGIGEKGAYNLIQKYNNLDGVYENLIELSQSLQNKLIEGKQSAYLSLTLATIKTDCEINCVIDDFKYSYPFGKEFYDICLKYDFKSILKNNDNFCSLENLETEEIECNAQICKNQLNKKISYQSVSIVTKEYGLDVSFEKNIVYKVCDNVQSLKDLISEICLVTNKIFVYGLKEIKKQFKEFKINFSKFEDVEIVYYLLNANDKVLDGSDFCKRYNTSNLACAVNAHGEELMVELREKELDDLYRQIELPLVDVLVQMELNGVRVDREKIVNLDRIVKNEIDEVSAQIYKIVGYNLNLNSPKQLAKVLFEDLNIFVPGNKKLSTSNEILQKIENLHPVVPLIQKYRKLQKVKSTYIDVYLESEVNGFIYAHFLQTVTGTGRLSCKNPNLQNIPVRDSESKSIRDVFVSRFEGGKLISFDYDQIELRLMAHFSKDESMIEAFLSNQDIHTATASKIFNIPLEDVTKEQRSRSKAVNFGIIYGQSAYGLSETLGITVKEAKQFIENYFATFPKVKVYMEDSVTLVKENNNTAITLFGRKRFIPELQSSNFQLRSFGERVAINMPLQGTASDIIKQAMIKIQEKISEKKLQAKLILQIHDELVFDVPKEEVGEVESFVKDIMESVTKLSVPLTVSEEIGETLYNLNDVKN